ncbi:MAG: hypothetical protein OJF48_003348 [Afipia sp.]|jgi:hypothetical protein|nr:MAG: hypothetical protein OJF48_003348 [Afipia sp.]
MIPRAGFDEMPRKSAAQSRPYTTASCKKAIERMTAKSERPTRTNP